MGNLNGLSKIQKIEDKDKTVTIKAFEEGESTIKVAVDSKTTTCKIITKKRSSVGSVVIGISLLVGLIFMFVKFKDKTYQQMSSIRLFIANLFVQPQHKNDNQKRKAKTKVYNAADEKIKKLSNKIAELQKDNNNLKKENDELKNKKTSLSIEVLKTIVKNQIFKNQDFTNYIKSVINEVSEIQLVEKITSQQKQNNIKNRLENTAMNSNILYAEAINNKEFYNVSYIPSDLSVFVLELTGGLKANFKVYSGAEKRVIIRPGNLEGCETDIIQGGKSLQTITTGKAREINGKWIVEIPLKIKII